MNVTKILPIMSFVTLTAVAPMKVSRCFATDKPDTFTRTIQPLPPATGSSEAAILAYAPNPEVTVNGKKQNAIIVVDIGKNVLYKYDEEGVPEMAYRIASGKRSTPTHKGIRVISHTEDYPYRYAYGTKRKRYPRDYGPHIIILRKIDVKTGETAPTGEFIHGNRNAQAVIEGRYASHGCMRMDNNVITELYKQVKPGQIVIVK